MSRGWESTDLPPTSGRELLGVDDLGSILLASQHLHTPADDREGSPRRTEKVKKVRAGLRAASPGHAGVHAAASGWVRSHLSGLLGLTGAAVAQLGDKAGLET